MTVHGHLKQKLQEAGFTRMQAKAVIALALADGGCALVRAWLRSELPVVPAGIQEHVWRMVRTVAAKYAAAFLREGERRELHRCILMV